MDAEVCCEDWTMRKAIQLWERDALVKQLLSVAAFLCIQNAVSHAAGQPLADKTLVAWVAPANLTQGGGSALTLDDG